MKALGLSLAALRAFREAHAGKTFAVYVKGTEVEQLPFDKLSTAQVCSVVEKPLTANALPGGQHCSYAERLQCEVACTA